MDTMDPVYVGWLSILPPVIAIVLALLTKEVISSLLVGILSGALIYSLSTGANPIVGTVETSFKLMANKADISILLFLALLGALVVVIGMAGGSRAYGRWAGTKLKSRRSAMVASGVLGGLIFIDDYFNCLTVGTVMKPVTDKHNISRAKLAYIIDSTAAPICIIAPISSWAAAVAGFAEDGQGLNLFIKAIPFNFYALLTILMLVFISILKLDYGPMARHERNAMETGDLFSGKNPYGSMEEEESSPNGRVLDLVFPILVLIVCCITGMIYSGGFFDGVGFVEAFSNSDASVGLMLGSAVAFIITLVYFAIRRSMPFSAMMSSIPEGFKAMVPAILILTFAWSLKGMTDSLGAKYFVRDFVYQNASNFQSFLPAIVFIIGCLLAFATGTSWGTFGMLIPIVQNVFPMDNPLAVVCISACMAGAVCGDHCSPISDTTILSSAGAGCAHLEHVSTQMLYACVVAASSTVGYVVSGLTHGSLLPGFASGLIFMVVTMLVLRQRNKQKGAAQA